MSEEPNTGFISEQPNIEEERRSKDIIQNGVNRTTPESIPLSKTFRGEKFFAGRL
jgi:hypothetical protein